MLIPLPSIGRVREWPVVGMGGGVVWGEVRTSTCEQLSGRGTSRDARWAVFRVASMVVRVLSCGSGYTFGVSARSYLLDCWVPQFPSGKLPGVG